MQDFKEWVMIKTGAASVGMYKADRVISLDKQFYELLSKLDDDVAEEIENIISELQEILMEGVFIAGVAEGKKIMNLLDRPIDQLMIEYINNLDSQ